MMRLFVLILGLLILISSCKVNEGKPEVAKNDGLRNKYASIVGVSKSEINNVKLYSFVDEWYGVNYKYGGMSKSGVDCSGFCNVLYSSVYNKEIGRRVADIAQDVKKVSRGSLKEGDFVFFNISKKKNSHIGIYLMNNKFVHASTSKGVLISSLDNPYYKKVFNKGGRL